MIASIPYSSKRAEAMSRAFLELDFIFEPRIVEVGRTRGAGGMESDGYSTYHFAKYAHEHGGSLTSVDCDPATEMVCKMILEGAGVPMLNVAFVNVQSNSCGVFVGNKIDLLFLDGPDCMGSEEQKSAEWHLACFQEMKDHLSVGALVMVDDCSGFGPQEPSGKGRDAIPYMESLGYETLVKGYATLMRKPRA